MLAKITSKNQLTLPKAVLENFKGTEYFEVTAEDNRIVLRPLRFSKVDAVRSKLAALGINERHASAAVKWARRSF